MGTQTDYVIGMIRSLSDKHQAEMQYAFALENEVEKLKKQIVRLKKKLASRNRPD